MTDNKYKNGKIYTIRYTNDDTLIYVGSTTQPLYIRFMDHKKNETNEKIYASNMLLYQKMRETDINDWYVELYEDFQAEKKEQLNKREGEIIREIATLKKRIEGRTPKEWIVTNKNKLKQYNKDYYETNKEKTLKKTIF
jgi:hypothetical protein